MTTLKKNISLLVLILSIYTGSNVFSQDIINLVSGDIIIATNIVIKPNQVDYQNFNDKDGKVLSLPKINIKTITYNDGTEVKMVSKNQSSNKPNLAKNLINFNLFDFIISNLTISYERILNEGKFGIQIPFSIGYKDETSSIYIPIPGDIEYTNKLVSKFCTGINFNLYPTGQGKFKYFLGPSFLYGNGLYHDRENNYSSTYEEPYNTNYFKLLLNNGIIFTPVDNLSFSIIGSIGIQHMLNKEIKKTETTGALALNLSLRF